MPLFSYQAVDPKTAVLVKDEIEKDNIEQVRLHIETVGLMAVEIKKISVFQRDLFSAGFLKPAVNQAELGVFCRQLGFLLEAGISISTAVSVLYRQLNAKPFKTALLTIGDRLQKGYSLTDALQECRIFPSFLVSMVRVGEISGRLDMIFSTMAGYYEKKAKTREELKSALLYPALVALMMLGVIIIAVVFVVPNYAAMFASAGAELPLVTRMLIESSRFMAAHYGLLLALPVLPTVGMVLFYRTAKGRWVSHWLLLNTPFLKIVYLKAMNLNFAQTFSILLDSGILLLQSVEMVKKVLNNAVMDEILEEISVGLAQGKSLGSLMEENGYFEPLLCSMVRIGEETGSLPKLMGKSAEYSQLQMDQLLVRVNKLIEPVVIVVLGIVLGFVMLAILLPTFTLAYFV